MMRIDSFFAIKLLGRAIRSLNYYRCIWSLDVILCVFQRTGILARTNVSAYRDPLSAIARIVRCSPSFPIEVDLQAIAF